MMNRRTRREIAAPLFQDTPSLYAIHVAHLRLLRLRLMLPAPPHPTSTLQLIRPPSDDSPFFHVVHACWTLIQTCNRRLGHLSFLVRWFYLI